MVDNSASVNVDLGEVVDLGGGDSGTMESIAFLKTTDFAHPIGEEVPLEQPDEPVSFFERIIDESDLMPVWFLEQGVVVQRAVARVVLTKPHGGFPPGTGWASGFMVAPTLFLTNNHVIPNQAFTNKIRMEFNFQKRPDGTDAVTESFTPVVDEAFHTNPALDYTLVRLLPNAGEMENDPEVRAGDRWGWLSLSDQPPFTQKQHYNIIQHPAGRQKEIALQDNEISKLFLQAVQYSADTEPGSSGSPVLTNLWQLIALHHAGGEQDETGKWLSNQGIRIDRIVQDLRTHFVGTGNQDVLDELGI